MKIFALTRENKILRLDMISSDLESQVCSLFEKQYQDFVKHSEVVEFSAGNRNGVTDDERFVINDFEASELFYSSIESSDKCGVYDPGVHPIDSIVAIFVRPDEKKKLLLFQYFDLKQRLSNERFIIFSQAFKTDKFQRLDGAGFVLDTKLVAVLEESSLYFLSFYYAKRVFDLKDYFREATDQELYQFNQNMIFNPLDNDLLCSMATATMREKIFEIEKSGVLVNLDKERFQAYAKLADLDVVISDDKINLPNTKKDFKKFLSLLCEDYYEGGLIKRVYLSTGKRVAKK